MKSLNEIEDAIAKLSKESKEQLLRDIPALCADVFPRDGWDAIIADTTPRPALSSLLDQLEGDYAARAESFLAVNEENLRKSSDIRRP